MSASPDIVLVNPYCLAAQPARKMKMEPYAPLGLLSLAAWLRERGRSAQIVDGTFADSLDSIVAEADDAAGRAVGVFAMNSFRGEALRVVSALARGGRAVLCGGPDPSIYPEIYLAAGASVIAHSEGELTLADLLDQFERNGEDLSKIAGLSFKTKDGIIRTPPRAPIASLDTLPLPAHDLIDMRRYTEAWKSAHDVATAGIMTSRGCPFACNWCARPIFGKNYRLRRVEAVIDEIRALATCYGIEHFWVFDDTFVVRKSWVESFCAALRDAELDVTFECMARVDQVSEPILRLMKDAGCNRIFYGVESGSQKVLDAMEKGTRVEQIRRTAAWMHSIGIRMGAFIMYGYPGEEYDDILKTLDLIRTVAPDEISISVAHPMPGTGFYDSVRDELLANSMNGEDYHEGEAVFRTRYPAYFYRALKRRTEAEWRVASSPSLRSRLRAIPWQLATSSLARLLPPPAASHTARRPAAVRNESQAQRE